MDNEVDRSLASNEPPSGPTAANEVAPQSSGQGQPSSREKDRIAEITAEREYWKSQFHEAKARFETEIDDIRSQVEGMASRGQPQQYSSSPNSWGEVAEDRLRQVLRDPESDPGMHAAALEEMVRRRVESAVGQHRELSESEKVVDAYKNQVFAATQELFGDEARQGTDLWNEANELYAQKQAAYRRMYGREKGDKLLASNPDAMLASYAQAFMRRYGGERDELLKLRQERDSWRARESMEAGVSNALQGNENYQSARKARDARGMIRSLPGLQPYIRRG